MVVAIVIAFAIAVIVAAIIATVTAVNVVATINIVVLSVVAASAALPMQRFQPAPCRAGRARLARQQPAIGEQQFAGRETIVRIQVNVQARQCVFPGFERRGGRQGKLRRRFGCWHGARKRKRAIVA